VSATAVAVIDGSAIEQNLQRIRSAAPGCRILAVVKANAYGHGLEYVARLLRGADALAVARVGEGVRLRKAGISQPIVVLEGCADVASTQLAAQQGLDLVVHDPAHFKLLEAIDGTGVVRVWLKLDTGMGRLGFLPARLGACLRRLRKVRAVSEDIVLMTHLACADDPDNPLTMEQLRRFGEAAGRYSGDVSVANSAGVLLWPQTLEASLNMDYAGANWVRPGLALYGASPVRDKSARELGLTSAMTFRSQLIAVKTVKRGTTVGYGATWRAARETVIGVVAAGYGDGYPRQLPTGTPVLVNDRRVALIGRVSMDMINVDLTDVPVAAVGDPVTLWGGHLPIEEIAARAGTIPYELMCGLSERVEYHYVDTARAVP
jgi:alanine racemase